ncbi:MAG TPA: PDZ domain-containing protein, partial [Firmicutes bacterium]|nr:PDZ domain-containing protein [Bacillota bacterium]
MRRCFLPFAGFHNVRNAGWLGHASFGNKFLLALLVACTVVSFMVRPLTALPQEIQLATGQTHNLPLPYGITGRLQPRNLPGNVVQVIRTPGHHLALNPLAAGEADLEFRLLGIVPVHSVVVKVLPGVQVMLGGHSIGVVVSTRGVLVTGVVPVRTPQGARSPAQQAGIAVGDIVLSVDGQEVKDEVHLSELVQAAGQEQRHLVIELERGGKRLQTSVSPVDTGGGVFRIGLAVRDATAGVGTLTFWDPASRRFAALGHMVTDSDTGQPIRLESGHIVPAGVVAIHQGRRGEPGEKVGVFLPDRDVLGDIEANTPYGITGTLRKTPANPTFPQPVALAGAATVHAGPAQ